MGILQYFGLALQKLTPEEQDICIKLGFDEELMRLLKTETDSPLAIENSNFIAAVVSPAKPEQAYTIIKNCKKRFTDRSMRLFANSEKESDTRIVSFYSVNESNILQFAGTNGKTQETTTEKLMEYIESWEKQCDFVVMGAGSDWLQLEFATIPEDSLSFAQEVFEICPDIADEINSEEKLIESIKRSKILGLWWD